jgi:hypothetical protein
MISSHPPPQPQLSPRSGKAPTTTNTTGLHGHRHHPTASSSSSSTIHNHNHTGSGSSFNKISTASTVHSSFTNNGNSSSSNTANGNAMGSGTGNNSVLKRGDACLFCRKRKLKCDAGESISPPVVWDWIGCTILWVGSSLEVERWRRWRKREAGVSTWKVEIETEIEFESDMNIEYQRSRCSSIEREMQTSKVAMGG